MNVLANNIANMNTTGFKGEKMLFTEHLVRSRGGESMLGEKLAFVRDIATVRNLQEGPIEVTGNPLDLAIRDEGYFAVGTDNGERYTRSGRLHIDPEGRLVTQNGDPILNAQGQPLTLSPNAEQIVVAADGTVSATPAGTIPTINDVVGKIRIVRFDNPQEMEQISGGLLDTQEAPIDVENPQVVQHALESSNIEPIIEMARMIEVNRSYSSVSKMITAENERMKKMVETLAAPLQA